MPFLMIFMVAAFVDRSIADMYKWVDENGIAHFSDAPPDDADNSDSEKDKEAARRKAQIDRQKGVPFAVINGKGISGYNVKAYNDALRQSSDQKGIIDLTIDGKKRIYMKGDRHYISEFDIKND